MLQTEGDAALLEEVNEWQLLVQDFLEGELGGWEPEHGINAVYYTGRSLDDALSESVSGEIFLFVVTCESEDFRGLLCCCCTVASLACRFRFGLVLVRFGSVRFRYRFRCRLIVVGRFLEDVFVPCHMSQLLQLCRRRRRCCRLCVRVCGGYLHY